MQIATPQMKKIRKLSHRGILLPVGDKLCYYIKTEIRTDIQTEGRTNCRERRKKNEAF